MATKKRPVMKKSATKSMASQKKSSAAGSGKKIIKKMYSERNPDDHKITGKFKYLYVLFMCTTLFFMALSVWLFVFATEVQNKYESVEACARAHTSCHVEYTDNGEMNVEEAE